MRFLSSLWQSVSMTPLAHYQRRLICGLHSALHSAQQQQPGEEVVRHPPNRSTANNRLKWLLVQYKTVPTFRVFPTVSDRFWTQHWIKYMASGRRQHSKRWLFYRAVPTPGNIGIYQISYFPRNYGIELFTKYSPEQVLWPAHSRCEEGML